MSGFENEISLYILITALYSIWPVVLCIIHILHSSEKGGSFLKKLCIFGMRKPKLNSFVLHLSNNTWGKIIWDFLFQKYGKFHQAINLLFLKSVYNTFKYVYRIIPG